MLAKTSPEAIKQALADAAPTRAQRSLFGDILDWLLVPLLLLWPLSLVIIWVAARGIANRPFDRELGEAARTLARRVSVTAGTPRESPSVRVELAESSAAILRGERADAFFFQVLGTRGERLASANHEVSRRLVTAMETIRAVLDR